MRGRGHARANGLMNALDLGHVERSAGVAQQQGAGHFQSRHRLIAAFDDGARATRDNLSALQQSLDVRVVFPLLEGLERLESRILVIQADHEADVHPIIVEVIDESCRRRCGYRAASRRCAR